MSARHSTLHVVIAAGSRGEIGVGLALPWKRLKRDIERFRHITRTTIDGGKRNAVIMGRRTWESLGRKPLPGRVNIVLSRQSQSADGVVFASSVEECCKYLDENANDIEASFLIGGGQVVAAFLAEAPQRLGSLYITYVLQEFPAADTFVDLQALERFFSTLFYRVSDYDRATDLKFDFALRWQQLSDI